MKRCGWILQCFWPLAGCGRLEQRGQGARTSRPSTGNDEYMRDDVAGPARADRPERRRRDTARSGRPAHKSLLGDRRAEKKGDIMTVVIDIND